MERAAKPLNEPKRIGVKGHANDTIPKTKDEIIGGELMKSLERHGRQKLNIK